MTVPLSEDVASIVPVELIARNEIGALCAWITLATVFVGVEKMRTSPVLACGVALVVGKGVEGEGTGEGYAR